MLAIVPPRKPTVERRIMRRAKAYRCIAWFGVFASLGLIAFALASDAKPHLVAWFEFTGFALAGLAFVAALSAAVFRMVVTPQEVITRGPAGEVVAPTGQTSSAEADPLAAVGPVSRPPQPVRPVPRNVTESGDLLRLRALYRCTEPPRRA